MPYISLNLFRTSLRKQEQRQPTLSVSFFPSATAPALHLTASHRGWKPKADSVVGASRKACCELVKCPSGSSGESVVDGCSCKAGFSGTISASSASPYYTGSCSSVQCPSHSEGANVPKGCSCKAGYKGSIEASTTDPFYTGECSAVACPANSAGTEASTAEMAGGCAQWLRGKDVASGCSCLPGFAGSIGATTASPFFVGECYKGTIKATTAEPFYEGVCTPVACPANSAGNNVPGGCECLAGFSGSITGDDTKPWYEGSCTAVSCPKGSSGTDLPTGCTCKAGFSGSVTATKKTPYFSGGCDAVSCPDNSEGKNVPRGCSCKTGYTGTITATSSSPFFSGECKATCSLFTCPQGWKPKPGDTIGDTQDATPGDGDGVGGSGQTVSEGSGSAGCSCDAGFSGAVTPSSKSPFYENGCTAVQCPVHSTGKTVPSGCSCNAGYSGSITASSQTPFFAGSCEAVACPDHSSGADVPSGCKCHAGFSGAVQATTTAPFFTSTCKAVACPANSVGTDRDVANGCQCQAGYSGSIEASQKAPFYTGSCDAVACPKNAKGTDVPSGCTCKDGFSGSVSASTAAPYYTTTCTPVECPENSAGQNVPKGCICNAGYTGIIAAAPLGSAACFCLAPYRPPNALQRPPTSPFKVAAWRADAMTALWVQALLFGLFSALSLPLGALLGLALAPVSAKVTAQWMAFGGGALVFAVATQLFGESLFRLDASTWIHPTGEAGCGERCKELCVNNILQIFGAMVGAMMYLLLNRWLEPVGWSLQHVVREISGTYAICNLPRRLLEQPPQQLLPTSCVGFPKMQPNVLRCEENRSRPQEQQRGLRTIEEGGLELGVASMGTSSMTLSLRRASTLLEEEEEAATMGSAQVALSMWLGMMLDGIPEALMLGFMTNEGAVSFAFLVAIFIANFPEAFSGSSLLLGQKMPVSRMLGPRSLRAAEARGSDLARKRDKATALMEGITGGAMLAMVSTAMLPEAFKGAGDKAGLIFVLGFVLSVWITCLGYRFGGKASLASAAQQPARITQAVLISSVAARAIQATSAPSRPRLEAPSSMVVARPGPVRLAVAPSVRAAWSKPSERRQSTVAAAMSATTSMSPAVRP
eukprot:g21610.t1